MTKNITMLRNINKVFTRGITTTASNAKIVLINPIPRSQLSKYAEGARRFPHKFEDAKVINVTIEKSFWDKLNLFLKNYLLTLFLGVSITYMIRTIKKDDKPKSDKMSLPEKNIEKV
ncbi:uncharacterized protein LOC122849835 [Aphidius gifuensis]|uniref:uncharacterized protein LOC122849835 n=1 Tax=Aphidius gifuensis TaxID=684658 RepID=UPI001CDD2ED5|nr:uncharacterized protein LOC122849835 [Aphidius gifuensis]